MPRGGEVAAAAGRLGRWALVAALAAGALRAEPAQPVWPQQWREHSLDKRAPVTPQDAGLWAECGGEAAERAVYNSPVGRFGATAYRLKDATSALAWYELLKPENAVPARDEPTLATTPGTEYVAHQNYVLVFEGWRPLPKEMEALYKALPKLHSGGGLPKALQYLPEKDRRRNSERYILGLHSLEMFAPAVPGAVAGFEEGAEAQAARYQSAGGDVLLVIFEYPTPQVARKYEVAFGKLPGWQVKRTGPLVAVVPAEAGHAVDAAAARALLDPIEWNLEFTWYESAKRHEVNVRAMVWGAIQLTGFVLALVCFGGIFFAAIGVWLRRRGMKEGEESGLTLLRLNG